METEFKRLRLFQIVTLDEFSVNTRRDRPTPETDVAAAKPEALMSHVPF